MRHGQTGTILLSRVIKDAIVIPQRATYEILAKKYAYVVDKEDLKDHMEQAAVHDAQGHEKHGEKHRDHHNGKHAEEHIGNHESEHAADHGIVHQREIVILKELDDIFLIKKGLDVNDKIILEGVRQVATENRWNTSTWPLKMRLRI